MFRNILSAALRQATRITARNLQVAIRNFSGITANTSQLQKYQLAKPKLLELAPVPSVNLQRNLTKFSLIKGKRKTVKAVLKRFKRLDWGGWIRTRCGRHKKLFKKSPALKKRLRQHVLINGSQSWLLDSMVCKYWRRPRHYINDIYTPYHKNSHAITERPPKF